MPEQNFINRYVSNAIAGAGNLAGGIVDSAGKSVQGVGRNVGNTVTNTAGGWGDGVREHGNNIKDYTKASGERAQTKQNPLGMKREGNRLTQGSGNPGVRAGAAKGTASNPLGLSR